MGGSRVTQEVVEVLRLGEETAGRVTQYVVELQQVQEQPAQDTQYVIELLFVPADFVPPVATDLAVDCVSGVFTITGTDLNFVETLTVTRDGFTVEAVIQSATSTTLTFTLPDTEITGPGDYCVTVQGESGDPSTLCATLTCPGCPVVLDPTPPDPPEPADCPGVEDAVIAFDLLTTNPEDGEDDIVTSDGQTIIVESPEP